MAGGKGSFASRCADFFCFQVVWMVCVDYQLFVFFRDGFLLPTASHCFSKTAHFCAPTSHLLLTVRSVFFLNITNMLPFF